MIDSEESDEETLLSPAIKRLSTKKQKAEVARDEEEKEEDEAEAITPIKRVARASERVVSPRVSPKRSPSKAETIPKKVSSNTDSSPAFKQVDYEDDLMLPSERLNLLYNIPKASPPATPSPKTVAMERKGESLSS